MGRAGQLRCVGEGGEFNVGEGLRAEGGKSKSGLGVVQPPNSLGFRPAQIAKAVQAIERDKGAKSLAPPTEIDREGYVPTREAAARRRLYQLLRVGTGGECGSGRRWLGR
jgi:hypothetical protein